MDMGQKFNLSQNESVIMKEDRISHGGTFSGYTDELVLTNLQIILVSKGVFGNVKNIEYFPLSQLKVFNNQAQVFVGKKSNGTTILDIYFFNGEESFGFESKKRARLWVESINNLMTGQSVNIDSLGKNTSSQFDGITEQLSDTAVQVKEQLGLVGDSFKSAFGIQSKNRIKENKSEKITMKCPACGAPLSGEKGIIIRCQYCDTDTRI